MLTRIPSPTYLSDLQAYDVVVARAVAELRVLVELCLPFVSKGGIWVAAKGHAPEAEVEAARSAIGQLGGQLVQVQFVHSFSPQVHACMPLCLLTQGPYLTDCCLQIERLLAH